MKTTITDMKFIAIVVCLVILTIAVTGCQSKSKDIIDPSLFPTEHFTTEEARVEVIEWLRMIDREDNKN